MSNQAPRNTAPQRDRSVSVPDALRVSVVVVIAAIVIYSIVILSLYGPWAMIGDWHDMLTVPAPWRAPSLWILWILWMVLPLQWQWFRQQSTLAALFLAAVFGRAVVGFADWPPTWPWSYFASLSILPYLTWRNWGWLQKAQQIGFKTAFRELWNTPVEAPPPPAPIIVPEPTTSPTATATTCHCGTTLQQGWRTCPSCGTLVGQVTPLAPVTQKACAYCGTTLQQGWRTCPSCGTLVGQVTPLAPGPTQATTAPTRATDDDPYGDVI